MSVVIPIRNDEGRTRYFSPRYAKITVGQAITWYNPGNEPHSLIFDIEIKPYPVKIGIQPSSTFSKPFPFYVPRIDYSCATHPEEKGSIVIYPKDENDMTNTDTLRHLQGVIGSEPPPILSHLQHKPTTYGKKVLPDVASH
jgi:hypothetical protein